jgi:membrane protease YdiL (CAAX protease family)
LDNNNYNIPEQDPGVRKAPLANTPPLLFIFLSLSAVFFLYQIVGSGITVMFFGTDMDINESNIDLTRTILTFAQYMFILFPAVVLVMLQGSKLKETFRLYKPKMSVFALAIIGILVIQPFLQVYLYYQNELIFNLPFGKEMMNQLKEIFDALETTTEKLVTANSIPEFIFIVFIIAVTPSICEEFLFRGLVFRNFEKIIPASKAIFVTGLLFALFHFHPFNLIPLAVLGIFLTFIVYHSGSIYTAIVCHFINNFLSALALYIYGSENFGVGSQGSMSPEDQIQFLVLGIFSLLVFLSVIYFIRKYSITTNTEDKIQKHSVES